MTRGERFSQRLHARLGTRVVWIYVLVGLVNALVASSIQLLTSVLYIGLSAEEVVVVGGVAAVVGGICIVATALIVRPMIAPAFGWFGSTRDHDHAVAAWSAAVRGIDRSLGIGWALFAVAYIPYAVFVTGLAELPLYNTPLIYLFLLVGITFAATLDYFAFQWLVRPVVQDAAETLPATFEPDYRAPTLRLRLVVVMTVVTTLAGILTSAASNPEDGARGVAIGLGVAVAVMLFVGLPPAMLLADDVARPLRAITRGTRSVERGDLATSIPVLGADEVAVLALRFNRMTRGLQEREALRDAMGSYVDPEVAHRLMTEGQLIAGEDVTGTVMFVDIRGFSRWCEDHSPSEAVERLNAFYEGAIPAIVGHGGHVNKFLGDGLLAVFGAPVRCDDHADRALRAAVRVRTATDARFGGDVQIGVGLNTGAFIVGTVGGGGRLEFGVIGDVVNVASRVEQMTKETGDHILLTGATRAALADPPELVARGATQVRGMAGAVDVYAFG